MRTRIFQVSGGGSAEENAQRVAEPPLADQPIAYRPGTDRVRFEIAPAVHDRTDLELLVFVNDVEVTHAGPGTGMHPDSLLTPENRLLATTEPQTVPMARCDCGEYGCAGLDVRITRVRDVVLWDWSDGSPINRGMAFDAEDYDREVSRIQAIRSEPS